MRPLNLKEERVIGQIRKLAKIYLPESMIERELKFVQESHYNLDYSDGLICRVRFQLLETQLVIKTRIPNMYWDDTVKIDLVEPLSDVFNQITTVLKFIKTRGFDYGSQRYQRLRP